MELTFCLKRQERIFVTIVLESHGESQFTLLPMVKPEASLVLSTTFSGSCHSLISEGNSILILGKKYST